MGRISNEVANATASQQTAALVRAIRRLAQVRATPKPVVPPLRAGVHHLALKSRDLARSERFYAGVLGLKVISRHEDERGLRSVWLALAPGNAEERPFLALERWEAVAAEHASTVASEPAGSMSPALAGIESTGWCCVALPVDVEQREQWRTHLASAGHPVHRETPFTLYVRDPDGAEVALSHHPVPASSALARSSSVPPPSPPDEVASGAITSRLAALVSLSILLLSSFVNGSALAQRRARTTAPPPDVLILGSSSVNGALGRLIESELTHAGMRPERRGRSSSGFARPDFFDWESEIASLGDLRAMRGVIVYAGGNDGQAIRLREREIAPEARGDRRARRRAEWIPWQDEARWRDVYRARVQAFVDALCAAGARRVVVLLPAEGENEGWSERMRRIHELQAAGVAATRCGVAVDPRGGRLRTGATVDGVHLSRSGARAVWERVGPSILAALSGT